MNILVLMAGKGKRFTDEGYTTPKPLLKVNGKPILQWTTESCPYITHTGMEQSNNIKLYFAILQEHINADLVDFLYSVYGKNIHIITFPELTKGNLETAYIACNTMSSLTDELLVLDSDNKYSSAGIKSFISELPKDKSTAAIFVFNNTDQSLPNKWANAKLEKNIVSGIREKDDTWVSYPSLIGTFYFSSTKFFIDSANKILKESAPVKGEYYMSMVPTYTTADVYGYTVTDVVPLGTPNDVKLFGRIE